MATPCHAGLRSSISRLTPLHHPRRRLTHIHSVRGLVGQVLGKGLEPIISRADLEMVVVLNRSNRTGRSQKTEFHQAVNRIAVPPMVPTKTNR